MKKKCSKCNWSIYQLDLSDEDKVKVWGLVKRGFKIFAIDYLYRKTKLGLKDAKGVILHFNKDYGKCHRCSFSELDYEKIECPKCKAFNYNFKIEFPFNEEFCLHLEWSIDFDDLEEKDLRGFWCDGIDAQPVEIESLIYSNLVKNKIIKTTAKLGKSGQDVYEMYIIFGEESLKNYSQNKSIIGCIPSTNSRNWINVDLSKKQIKITLK